MGLTGCGPTCLSMVASYLLQNPKLTPIYMADYAIRNAYCVSGSGTSWDFMSKGAAGLEDGMIKMNDPNSREHSRRLWEFEEIKEQIRNIWVYKVRG